MEKMQSTARISTHDLAHKLGLSQSTVSRALRGDHRISAPVRTRVRETAESMGYRPDPMLAALAQYKKERSMAGRHSALAWLVFREDPRELLRFKEFKQYWDGASDEANRAGYNLESFTPVASGISPERMEKIFVTRNITGILVPPSADFPAEWMSFGWERFCVIKFGYSIPALRAHIVTTDQLTDGVLAVQAMRERGYRRIGLVTEKLTTTRFLGGYAASLMPLPPEERLPPLILTTRSKEDRRDLRNWVVRNKPDVILTDVLFLLPILENLGLKVPRDIAVASTSVLDGITDAGIYQNSEEVGRAAVQFVISLINHNERGIPNICRELLIEGRWQDGKAVPDRRTRASGPSHPQS